ncbi:MAG: thiolase family protein [Planctomycetota bacterium]|jgi:acetyl-CoA acetyltransferase family protein|nr:thiolase family protein [Planctomycetota bacterium]
MFKNTYLAAGSWWSTPFSRWQGSFANQHSMKLAAQVAESVLAKHSIPGEAIDSLVLGLSVPQRSSFYGAPWMAGMLGLKGVTGPTVAQACATSVRMIAGAAAEVELGARKSVLAIACDRTSNGPHVYYPNPDGPGGQGTSENPVMDNFNRDPHARGAMIATAENVASAEGISREAQEALTLIRHEQYQEALANDRAFQRQYMEPVIVGQGKRAQTVEADEGVFSTTAEGLAGLRPVVEGGTVTFGCQTHPADANAGLIICSRPTADELSAHDNVSIQILSYGEARVAEGLMPMAVVPAAMNALERADITMNDVDVIKTHNPFAVNDIYFSRMTGIRVENFNNFGSPLIYGHPQGPMGMRAIIELCSELKIRGGGIGLFTGCAAGDSAMALLLRVTDRN